MVFHLFEFGIAFLGDSSVSILIAYELVALIVMLTPKLLLLDFYLKYLLFCVNINLVIDCIMSHWFRVTAAICLSTNLKVTNPMVF